MRKTTLFTSKRANDIQIILVICIDKKVKL